MRDEQADVGHARRVVVVLVGHVIDDDGDGFGLLPLAVARGVFIEQRHLPGDGEAVVAGADKVLEAELVEVGGEVLEDVTLEWIVAVAVDGFCAEGVGIELEVGFDFLLDVDITV